MTWHATFGGSLTEDGKLTSGVGNRPAWRVAASTGLSYARKWDAYEGVYSDTDADFLLDVWQLRHWETENSGTLEGCTNYNYQYTVAFPEEQVTWVTLSKANGDHLLAGSEVEIGSHPEGTSNDRNTGTDYDICAAAKVVRVEAVTIDEVAYDRIHLDATDPFDVPATAYLSTMPWSTGSTEAVPWHKDGSINSCTDGRSPARIAGVEVLDGAYALGLDPLWVSTWNEAAEDGLKGRYHVWECRDSEKQSSAVTN